MVADSAHALPDYALELAAFHRAFHVELRQLLELVPYKSDARVLDVACGDGFYSELLGDRLDGGGVVGLDINAAFLELARRRAFSSRNASLEFIHCDLEQAATRHADSFDAVWCAQSLYSFVDPATALRLMRKLVRPGGIVAILENDTLHQLLLPWSSAMELDLRQAERQAFEVGRCPSKFYIGRRLPSVLADAGIRPVGYRTQAIDRTAPLDPALELFLRSYFVKLLQRVEPYLPPVSLERLREQISPEANEYLPRRPYFTLTWLNVLCWGTRDE